MTKRGGRQRCRGVMKPPCIQAIALVPLTLMKQHGYAKVNKRCSHDASRYFVFSCFILRVNKLLCSMVNSSSAHSLYKELYSGFPRVRATCERNRPTSRGSLCHYWQRSGDGRCAFKRPFNCIAARIREIGSTEPRFAEAGVGRYAVVSILPNACHQTSL